MKWLPIPGFNYLEASEDGQIRSILQLNSRGHRLPVRILKQQRMRNGYLTVTVRKHGAPKFQPELVHRLVCLAFRGVPQDDKTEVRHLDGSRINNNSDNLVWGTGVENQADRKRHGTHLDCENAPGAKLTNIQAMAIRKAVESGMVQRRLAEQYGVSASLINLIVKGKTYCHAEALSVKSPLDA